LRNALFFSAFLLAGGGEVWMICRMDTTTHAAPAQPVFRVWLNLPTGRVAHDFDDEFLAVKFAVRNGAVVTNARILN